MAKIPFIGQTVRLYTTAYYARELSLIQAVRTKSQKRAGEKSEPTVQPNSPYHPPLTIEVKDNF